MRNNDYLEKYINSLEKNLYPNITYLIKNELIAFTTTYTYIWKDEIFSKNKDNNYGEQDASTVGLLNAIKSFQE